MAVPTIDYDQQAIEQLPQDQRLPFFEAFFKTVVSQVKWLYGVFVAFMDGEALADYDSVTTYDKGDKVKYNFAAWESLQDGNTSNTPDTSPDYWLLRNSSFLGATERALYDAKKIKFECALNHYFGTVFRQPDDPVSPTLSDIYITTVVPITTAFLMSPGYQPTGVMYPTYSTGVMFDPPVVAVATTYEFTINIPTATYAALGTAAEEVVRNFADRINTAGTSYNIATY